MKTYDFTDSNNANWNFRITDDGSIYALTSDDTSNTDIDELELELEKFFNINQNDLEFIESDEAVASSYGYKNCNIWHIRKN